MPGGLRPLEGSRAPGTPSPRAGLSRPGQQLRQLFPWQPRFWPFLMEHSSLADISKAHSTPKRHPSDYSPHLADEDLSGAIQ